MLQRIEAATGRLTPRRIAALEEQNWRTQLHVLEDIYVAVRDADVSLPERSRSGLHGNRLRPYLAAPRNWNDATIFGSPPISAPSYWMHAEVRASLIGHLLYCGSVAISEPISVAIWDGLEQGAKLRDRGGVHPHRTEEAVHRRLTMGIEFLRFIGEVRSLIAADRLILVPWLQPDSVHQAWTEHLYAAAKEGRIAFTDWSDGEAREIVIEAAVHYAHDMRQAVNHWPDSLDIHVPDDQTYDNALLAIVGEGRPSPAEARSAGRSRQILRFPTARLKLTSLKDVEHLTSDEPLFVQWRSTIDRVFAQAVRTDSSEEIASQYALEAEELLARVSEQRRALSLKGAVLQGVDGLLLSAIPSAATYAASGSIRATAAAAYGSSTAAAARSIIAYKRARANQNSVAALTNVVQSLIAGTEK